MSENIQNIHYLQHVTTMGEHVHVVTHQPIYSLTGIKLVDVGVPIKQELLGKLAKHNLFPDIDECLTVANCVSPNSLAQDIKALLASESSFSHLLHEEASSLVIEAFSTLELPPAIAFKLTVAREQRADVYRHSLEVGLLAAILQSRIPGTSIEQIREAAFTGLFHDMGLLHINPELLRKDTPLPEEARHHLYSHPIIANLILQKVEGVNTEIAVAVLQHHERLDGSGYPRGLKADHLSDLGQILAVAEIGATLLAQRTSLPLKRLVEVVLRMNYEKIHPVYAGYLETLLCTIPSSSLEKMNEGASATALPSLIRLAIAINHWKSIRTDSLFPEIINLIDERIARLSHALADVGIDLDYWTTYDPDMEEDKSILAEIECIGREGSWQLNAITQELRRRWGSYLEQNSANCRLILEWISATEMGKTWH